MGLNEIGEDRNSAIFPDLSGLQLDAYGSVYV
jgi:hypothetical protein